MGKLLSITKKTAEFQQLKQLRKELANRNKRNKLSNEELAAKNEQFRTLQSEVVRSDTVTRQERAEAKVLSSVVLPKTFVPFDPKGSGFIDSLKQSVSSSLTSIFGGPSQYVEAGTDGGGSGTVLGGAESEGVGVPSQGFFSGVQDIISGGIADRNEAISEFTNAAADAESNAKPIVPILAIGAAVAFFIFKRKGKGRR